MRLRYGAILMLAAPPVMALLTTMVLATIHNSSRAVCRSCNLHKVRPSWPRNILERFYSRLGLVPYKCDGCLDRFYGWRHKPPRAVTP